MRTFLGPERLRSRRSSLSRWIKRGSRQNLFTLARETEAQPSYLRSVMARSRFRRALVESRIDPTDGKKMNDQSALDVLAVFSHPDDAELTMAGTLLKLKSLGYRVGLADMTRGEMGTRGTPEIRAKESLDAARVMSLDARVNVGLPDGHLALNEDSKLAVVRVLRKHRPKVVFTTHWDDPHPDHAATAHIVRESARLATMRRYDKDNGFEPI